MLDKKIRLCYVEYRMKKKNRYTKKELKKIAKKLSKHFNIKTPKVKINIYSKYCYYNTKKKFISVYFNNLNETNIQTFLHEFSHHLAREKFGIVEAHGKIFCDCLKHVLNFWYNGIIEKYNFSIEYDFVKNYFSEKNHINYICICYLKKDNVYKIEIDRTDDKYITCFYNINDLIKFLKCI